MTAARERRPARIAFFATQSGSGGVRELWVNLADGFVARGHQVSVAALYSSPHDASDIAPPPWRHIVERRPRGPMQALGMIIALGRWLRRERPDVVITAQPVANVVLPIVARLSSPRTRVFISHHSPIETHHPATNFVDGLSGRLSNVRGVISVSDAVSDSLAGKAESYRAKRATIRNALPPDIRALLDSLHAAHAPRAVQHRRLVTTGRLASQKNYPLMLRAMALLPDTSLDVIGSGPDEARLNALAAELGVADRVRFLGFRPREEALRLLAAGDLFIQVSLFEGHSLALIEAAALGLPLIVSNVPVQVEAVTLDDGTSCALKVGIADAEALAAAVRSLLDDPDRYRAASANARRLADAWTFKAMLDRYENMTSRD